MSSKHTQVGLRSRILDIVSNEVELISDLLVTTVAGVAYGYIEAFWVPSSVWQPAVLILFGKFAYYHVGFLILMLALTTGLVATHFQWFDRDDHRHKAHIIYAGSTFLAISPLAFMVEDMTWFTLQLRPIGPNDWTMMIPYVGTLGLNLRSTWLPAWYIGVFISTWVFLTIAMIVADKSYQGFKKHLQRNLEDHRNG